MGWYREGKRLIDRYREGKRLIDRYREGKRLIDRYREGKRLIDRYREGKRRYREGKSLIDRYRHLTALLGAPSAMHLPANRCVPVASWCWHSTSVWQRVRESDYRERERGSH